MNIYITANISKTVWGNSFY